MMLPSDVAAATLAMAAAVSLTALVTWLGVLPVAVGLLIGIIIGRGARS